MVLPFKKEGSNGPPLLKRGVRGDFLDCFGSIRVIATDKISVKPE